MWPLLVFSFSLAMFGIAAVLNGGVSLGLNDAKSETKAAMLMNEHYCALRGSCVDGYTPNPGFARAGGNGQFAWARTIAPYSENQGYLPALLDRTKNSYLCVTQKKSGLFVSLPNSSAVACEGVFPASIHNAEKVAPNGAILIYQKK